MFPLLCFLAVSCLVLILVGIRLSCSIRKATDTSSGILNITITNNTYRPLLDVLSSLDSDLEKLGEELHADMRGYMDHDK